MGKKAKQKANPHAKAKKRCGAKTRAGGKCKNGAMVNGRCRMHGGKAKKGGAAPAFKHGRYSKYMPAGLLELASESLNDAQRLDLDGEIDAVTARIKQLFETIDSSNNRATWQQLLKLEDKYREAVDNGKPTGRIMNEVFRLITEGADHFLKWAEIVGHFEVRRKLVESQRKRVLEKKQYMVYEQGLGMIKAIEEIICRHITDDSTLRNISNDLAGIASGLPVSSN